MKLFIDIVMKRIYLFNTVAWNYRKKIGFPVCKKENFAGLQAHRKRGKGARASPTPHHTLNEERSARFTAQHLSALVLYLYCRLWRKQKLKRISIRTRILRALWVHVLVVNLIYRESIKEKIEKRKERDVYLYCRLWRKQRDKKSRQIHKASWSFGQKSNRIMFPFTSLVQQPFWLAVPRLHFKGRSLETETSSRWRELGNERLFLS